MNLKNGHGRDCICWSAVVVLTAPFSLCLPSAFGRTCWASLTLALSDYLVLLLCDLFSKIKWTHWGPWVHLPTRLPSTRPLLPFSIPAFYTVRSIVNTALRQVLSPMFLRRKHCEAQRRCCYSSVAGLSRWRFWFCFEGRVWGFHKLYLTLCHLLCCTNPAAMKAFCGSPPPFT
jgi:hypothetical protein